MHVNDPPIHLMTRSLLSRIENVIASRLGSMLDVFRGLKGLVKAHRVTIDSSIFRLHYSATVTFLLAFSLIVTTRQGFRQHTSTYSMPMVQLREY
jgi:hypothetical protein